jgi:hypothetical protein
MDVVIFSLRPHFGMLTKADTCFRSDIATMQKLTPHSTLAVTRLWRPGGISNNLPSLKPGQP